MSTRKCAYSHCLKGGVISDGDDDVVVGKKHYHKCCREEMDTVAKIKTIICDHICKDEKMIPLFMRSLSNILYVKKVPADYYLFCLQRKYRYIKHPGGLHYVPNDDKLKSEWDHKQSKKIVNSEKYKNTKLEIAEEASFVSNGRGDTKFGDIFGGN